MFTLLKLHLGNYWIINETNVDDRAEFKTAQDAIDFWDSAHPGETLRVNIIKPVLISD